MPREQPPYTIRESARAKRVTLRVSARRGVEVVVPHGVDKTDVPAMVAARADWIQTHLQRLKDKGWTGDVPRRPEILPLLYLGRKVTLKTADNPTKPPTLRACGPDALLLAGDTTDETACRHLVRDWLKAQARRHLVPLLRDLSAQHRLPFERAQIRAQASRWGSCSARGTISLNCKLMFLPPELTRHVLLHELAHIGHLDHSPKFWNLLTRLDPETATHDKALSDAWRYVPGWLG